MAESIAGLVLSVLLAIIVAGFVFPNMRYHQSQTRTKDLRFGISFGGFILCAYGIVFHLYPLFPKTFLVIHFFFASTGVALGCLFLGYLMNLALRGDGD